VQYHSYQDLFSQLRHHLKKLSQEFDVIRKETFQILNDVEFQSPLQVYRLQK